MNHLYFGIHLQTHSVILPPDPEDVPHVSFVCAASARTTKGSLTTVVVRSTRPIVVASMVSISAEVMVLVVCINLVRTLMLTQKLATTARSLIRNCENAIRNRRLQKKKKKLKKTNSRED
jgi:hypothetical protein